MTPGKNSVERRRAWIKTSKVAESITNEILLKMFLEKWDGKMPLVVGSEGATLLDLTKGR